ncbi:MAG: AMP-binding protein [Luteitalea sp.]|nr:AMP-binding protein [Luteitalea sp.]
MMNPRYQTIPETLLALQDCTKYGARFADRTGNAQLYPYGDVVDRAMRVAGTLQRQGLQPGDRVAIVLPTSIHFFDAFLGTMLAGGVPTALYPPVRLGKLTEYFARTARALQQIGARFLVIDPQIGKLIGPAVESLHGLSHIFDAGDLLQDAAWHPIRPQADAPALLQFSSGTTTHPKAVTLSHRNLMHSLEMIDGFVSFLGNGERENGGVCWLPLYHDMGLIGCLFMGLYHPATLTYLRPEQFLAKPALWLQTISRYAAAASPAPDFAYGLCLSRISDEEMDGVDLSSWRIAFNGAEAIDPNVMQRFIDRFSRWGLRPEALTPVYGLAEAGLAVTFSDPAEPAVITEFDREALTRSGVAKPGSGRRLPSVGRSMPGLDVEVRDQEARLDDGSIGRIWVRGPSITNGYYNDPESTGRLLRDGWLDTGDLGFFHRDNLYISGRAKDLIIIRGRNYAPQEIETLLTDLPGLRRGCAVAVADSSAEGRERLVILAERDRRSPKPDDELVGSIRNTVLSGLALTPDVIELLPPGTLPRTSSGKLRRAEALRMYQTRQLRPPARTTRLALLRHVATSQLAWARHWLRRTINGSRADRHADADESPAAASARWPYRRPR